MSLTNEQLTTLGNFIRASQIQAVVTALANGATGRLAELCNMEASPAFYVFSDEVTITQFKEDVVNWAEHLTLTDAQLAVVTRLFEGGSLNPRNVNVRTGLQAIFAGAGQANTRNALLSLAVRKASNAEKLFATDASGTPAGGDGSAANQAANPVFSGQVTKAEVNLALELTQP